MKKKVNARLNDYKAFGLLISSELLLPELLPCNQTGKNIDVTIKWGKRKYEWPEEANPLNDFIVKNNVVLFKVEETAFFYIWGGTNILISPEEGAEEDEIRQYVLGTCMGVVLMQRKILPLHGSAVVMNGKAFIIVGESGAGKSTLAAALLSAGCRLLSDDVVPVVFSEKTGEAAVFPAYPQQKLWQESLNAFGVDSGQYRPLIKRETKFAVPVTGSFAEGPVPIAGIFELSKTEEQEIVCASLPPLKGLSVLLQHTYRHFLIPELQLMPWHFEACARLAREVDCFQLQRPENTFTASALTAFVMTSLQKKEETANEQPKLVLEKVDYAK